MIESKYRLCNRCVMDTSDLKIVFNQDGICNHCTEYLEITQNLTYKGAESEVKLGQMIEKVKISGKGKKYDCIIGVSGGVDSIYLILLAVKWGLRPLAIHMDNGWNAKIAIENIEKALCKLNVDLNTEVLNWTEFRDLQLSFLKASVPEAENPTDMAIQGVLHKASTRHNVKYIFSGGNYVTEGILPRHFQYNPKDLKYLKAIHRRFGSAKLRTFPAFGFRHEFFYKMFYGKKILYPLNMVSFNKVEAMRVLKEELGWENYGEKHHESIYTKFVQSFWLPKKFGIDYRRATFSTMICAGEMKRDIALQKLQENPWNKDTLDEDLNYISKKLEISNEELQQFINSPARYYTEYPNAEKSLELGYSTYRKLFKK